MGFLDRFKKKNESQREQKANVPTSDMELNYSSGTKAMVTFESGEYVEDKYVSRARIVYFEPNGRFSSKNVLLEPVIEQGEDGIQYDVTKRYYTEMGQTPDTKGFFKQEEITEQKVGSDYIGKLDLTGDKPTRYFDSNFKQRYIEIYRQRKAEKERQQEEKNRTDIDNMREKMVNNSTDYNSVCETLDKVVKAREEQRGIDI